MVTYCDILMLNLIKVKILGGEAREFGRKASPLSPPLDETLIADQKLDFRFSQIEKLICCQSTSSDLSHDFLAQVTALQRGEGDYRKWQLSD